MRAPEVSHASTSPRQAELTAPASSQARSLMRLDPRQHFNRGLGARNHFLLARYTEQDLDKATQSKDSLNRSQYIGTALLDTTP